MENISSISQPRNFGYLEELLVHQNTKICTQVTGPCTCKKKYAYDYKSPLI